MTEWELYPHQEKALELTAGKNTCAYFLDMGLGKTFVGSEKLEQLGSPFGIVICQKSKITDWYNHFTEYYQNYVALDLTKTKDYESFITAPHYCIGIVNYDLIFRKSRLKLLKLTGYTLMLDESQMIRNENAKRSKAVLKMTPDNVILLSGTPSAGKYEKLWSQCRLLGWNISKTAYWNSYIETEWIEDRVSGFKREVVIGYKNTERLKKKLIEHGAVFMKTEEVFDLPEQQEVTIGVSASKEYKKFMKDSIIELNDDEKLVGDCILTKFLHARQLCGQYCEEKLQAFADLLESSGDRLIVFYNLTAELNRLIQIADEQNRPVSKVNGQNKDLTAYMQYDDSVTFVQYQAGAMGLNLQKANKTVYFTLPFGKGSCDLWQQSKKRTHRIGQNKMCLYYYLLCRGSIEERNLINLRLGKEYDDYLFEKECT